MKMVSIRRCPAELQRLLKAAKSDDVIIRLPSGGELLFSLIDDFDYEIAGQRRNPKLMAFLDRRFRRARKEKGVPLKEVKRRLGLPAESNGNQQCKSEGSVVRKIDASPRSQVVLGLLDQAVSEDVILKIPTGFECFLSAIPNGDYTAANRRRSEAVMGYLDEEGKVPPLKVVFVGTLPHRTPRVDKKLRVTKQTRSRR
jgi:hypothetical protein